MVIPSRARCSTKKSNIRRGFNTSATVTRLKPLAPTQAPAASQFPRWPTTTIAPLPSLRHVEEIALRRAPEALEEELSVFPHEAEGLEPVAARTTGRPPSPSAAPRASLGSLPGDASRFFATWSRFFEMRAAMFPRNVASSVRQAFRERGGRRPTGPRTGDRRVGSAAPHRAGDDYDPRASRCPYT